SRYRNLEVLIYAARVQGPEAAWEIVQGIRALNRVAGLDVLIVARGGGSLEDLWPFNEESVARALASSRVPTISAVGHETDFPIPDFVADLRAPPPTGRPASPPSTSSSAPACRCGWRACATASRRSPRTACSRRSAGGSESTPS